MKKIFILAQLVLYKSVMMDSLFAIIMLKRNTYAHNYREKENETNKDDSDFGNTVCPINYLVACGM